MNNLKILILNTNDKYGGAARAAYNIHEELRSQGIDSIMFVKYKSTNDRTVISINSYNNQDVFQKLTDRYLNKLKNKIQKYRWRKYNKTDDLSDLRSVSTKSALKKIEFDILHLHWINGRFFNLKDLLKLNKPVVWTLHDSWPFTGICHYFYDCENYTKTCGSCPFLNSLDNKDLSYTVWKKKKEIYSSLKLNIVAPSNWMAEAARKSSLLSGFPVTVIPNGVDTTLFSPGNKTDACLALDLNPNKKYLLFSAMKVISDKNKGFAELLQAIKFLDQTIDNKNLELLVIGSTISNEKIESQIPVRFLGMISSDIEMVMAYRSAEVTIVPSFSENLSNTIMESLSCGTPVVAFNTGGNADLVDHKKNGYLAIPGSSNDLANGISWCMYNNNDNKLSSKARLGIINKYSIEKISNEYINLYKSLIS